MVRPESWHYGNPRPDRVRTASVAILAEAVKRFAPVPAQGAGEKTAPTSPPFPAQGADEKTAPASPTVPAQGAGEKTAPAF